MLVTIAKCGTGKCAWCRTDGEGVQATFKDGLQGFFCRKDFWQAMKARAELEEPSDAQSIAGRKSA